MNIRVFTAFSGYDSQCMALDRLTENFPEFAYDLVGWSEIDKYAIQAHDAVYPQWSDRNYGDISKIDWSLVPDFDLFTYSSPCQDFSQAGKQAGGERGSGTRSSLLWECERAIDAKRPKYLLMENVAALVSKKFLPLFRQWQLVLERLGYVNFVQKMNAKHYGVPQNRDRVFMVSIYFSKIESVYPTFVFPKPFPLKLRLKDVLEQDVPEKYYLSSERLKGLQLSNAKEKAAGNHFQFEPTDGSQEARAITTHPGDRKTDNFVIEQVGDINPKQRFGTSTRQQNQVIGVDGLSPAITAEHAKHEFSILTPVRTVIAKYLRRLGIENFKNRELQPREDGISNTLTGVQKDNLLLESAPEIIRVGEVDVPTTHRYCREVLDPNGISKAVCCAAGMGGNQEIKIIEPMVLGWSRDEKGNIIDRHPVEVANTVTSGKRDNTQNYVVEPVNEFEDGISRTIKSQYQQTSLANLQRSDSFGATGVVYKGKVIKDGDGLNINASQDFFRGGLDGLSRTIKAGNDLGVCIEYRIRKLTEKECFRLMDVSEENIRKIQECGLSRSRQYKMAGNSIVVNCLYLIFRNLFYPETEQQTTLF